MTDSIPYAQIPDYPADFSANNVAARMIDGLGFRYYWATEGLTAENLQYKPSPEGRTTMATIEHLYGLTQVIYNTCVNQPTIRPATEHDMDFEEMRKATLQLLEKASLALKTNETKVDDLQVRFQRGDRTSEFPFWNLINGPIADALWHTGQVVSFRRAAGNPLESGVSVFMGTKK